MHTVDRYIYLYIHIYIYKKNKIGPFNHCSPQAVRVQRFDFYFHARRRAANCQYLEKIVSFIHQTGLEHSSRQNS